MKYLILAAALVVAASAQADDKTERKVRVALALAEHDAKTKPAAKAVQWFADDKCACCGTAAGCTCNSANTCGADPCPKDCVHFSEKAPMPHAKYSGPSWFAENAYPAAFQKQSETGRPMVLLFTEPDHCVYCRQLDAGALSDAGVVDALTKTVNVRVDSRTTAGADLVRQAKIASLPAVRVYRGGKLVGQCDGNVSAEELLKVLAK